MNLGLNANTINIVSYYDNCSKFKNFLKKAKYYIYWNLKDNFGVRNKNFRVFCYNIKYNRKRICYNTNLKTFDFIYDYFIVGSDQVWNYNMASPLSLYFLSKFKLEKRIAYSASFGVSDIPQHLQDNYKNHPIKHHQLFQNYRSLITSHNYP